MAVSTKKMATRKGQSATALMAVIAGDCYSVAMNSRGEEHLETGLEGKIPGSTEAVIKEEGIDVVPSRVAIWPVRRRVRLPLILFVVTCFSAFLAGACYFAPDHYLFFSSRSLREVLLVGWLDGLVYMGAVIAILLSHEMGHFLATVYYRIPASYPMFLPFPVSPIGTLGALIGMDGRQADRKEIYDIGIAGPLAGLVIAIPVLCMGIQQLDLSGTASGPWAVALPPLIQMLLSVFEPAGFNGNETTIAFSQLNPLFMAGWVGLLVTALNMMPVSQLDGGHILYALTSRWGHWLSRGFMVFAIAYLVFAENVTLILMVTLVLLMGTDHPPTRDDSVRLGWFRTVLGLACLLIPLFCFAPEIIIFRQ